MDSVGLFDTMVIFCKPIVIFEPTAPSYLDNFLNLKNFMQGRCSTGLSYEPIITEALLSSIFEKHFLLKSVK
ncbi:hypothetical protein A3I25_00320 [Candidatus Nomurabacteria bacterium RIFCSPLOWO2_02_FULL_42_17]|uniref:Uncharacterized protein n=1 Tax=Candidatus Nomurabacteria bacterium RIFCSPLOWO2_02_FULL_42_17 TaxID=1801789 RepID=A0A1F6XQW9_9BACT|nr:MAG: hypothetical protein A3I25_00320 [Candidatus Nomurabacteria bacterium RIFCSPLOWO2_02_FULL_42_17]